MNNLIKKRKIDLLISLSVFTFFIVINITYFYLNYSSLSNIDSYAFNELFINYQSGFIRRGFLGEIAWQLNDIFHIEPQSFFSIFFLLIYLFQIILFYQLFKKYISYKFIFIFIFFSPSLLLFHIYNPELYFLKDGIVKITILIHAFIFCYYVNYKKNHEEYFNYLKFFIIPVLFLVILTHEYQLFSISVHFLISLGAFEKKTDLKKLFKIFSPLIVSFFLVIIFFGTSEQFESMSLSLQKFDVELNPHLGGGFLKYLGAFYKWHFFYFSYRDFINLFFSIIFSLVIIYVLFQYMIEKKIVTFQSKFQKKYLFFFLPCILPFFLTTDHGRNLSLLSFYFISFYSTLNLNHMRLFNLNNKIQSSLFNKTIIIIFLIFFIFMWKLNQFAGFGLQGKPNDIFQSSLFAEFIKFVKFSYNFIDANVINLPKIKL